MELSELIFTAKTDDLERVSKVIGGLVTDITQLDKVSRDAAKTEATLAKAAKDHAKANLDNAKAQETSRKSVEATENAQRKATAATEKNTSILQRQADIYDFLAQGYSKGQAGILATAKATGQYSKELEEILKLQKQFTADPFDRSDMALNRMIRSLKEMKDAQSFTNQGMSLTTKQARELSNDLARLEASLKRQGKSYDEISKAQALHKQQFVEEAAALNRSQSAMDEVEKQRKEVVTATNYLIQADAKMAAALNTSNAALDKAGTDSLVKYETALRKSGVSQDVATSKLAKYKTQLTQVNTLEQKRREQHLARALSPQLTDIGVSLYSGQAPLTVLLQQGGQIADLLRLSGVEAQNFGKALRDAFSSMIPVMATVAKGLSGFVFGLFYDAGKGITNFIANVTGMNKVLQHTDDILYLIGGRATGFSKILHTLGNIASATFGVGVFAIVAGLVALAKGLNDVIKQENELNRAVSLSGGSMGATAEIANTYVARLGEVTGNSTKANEALIAMAKAGNITSDSIMLVGEAAIALNKATGVPIEDTVKQFDKLATAPGKTLIEIAKATGLISAETVELVLQYERAGQSAKAAEVAQKAYADATKTAAANVKENYGTLTTFAMGVASIFSKMWDAILGVGRSDNLDTRIDQLRARIVENSKATPGLFLTQERIDQDTKDLNKQFFVLVQQRQAMEDIGKQKEQNVKATKAEEELDRLRTQSMSSIEKHQQEITRLTNFRAQLEKDGLLDKKAEQTITAAIAAENKKIADELNKSKKDPSENYYATLMREATNNTIAANAATQELTKSEQKLLEVKADPRFAKLTATQQADVIAKYDAAIAAERQTAMTEKLAEAEEHRLKLLGKSEGVGKQYYTDMQKLEEFAKVAGWSREEIEELTRAVFQQTPAWKAYEKALEDVNTASRKFQEDSLASQASVLQENQSLNHRLSLLGKTAEEQKAITIEYQRANKIREVDIKLAKQLREIEEKIAEAKKKGLPESDYKSLIDAEIQARKDAAEQHKVINREVAVQYAEDMQREIDAIKSGISDSIVTALFEGGKAGSKKLRNLIVDQLKKPVTLVVQAAVNLLLGSLMGSVGLGGLASSALGSAGGSLLGSAAGSAAGGMFGNFLGGGSLTGMIGNITAGVTNGISTLFSQGIGSVFSQGTGLMAAGSTGGGLGTLLGGIGLPLLGIGALISGLSRKLKDVGIEGSFGGDTGFEGRKYKFYKGGFLRSDKTTYENLDPEMQKDLGNAFLGMKKSVADMAKTLGLGTEALEKFKTNIKVSFWNLKDDEIQAKLQEALATANNELAEQVIGAWETTTSTVSRQIQATFMEMEAGADAYRTVEETITASTYKASEYAREGEKAIDTLTRLATSLSTVNTTFGYLGQTLYDASLAGADLADKLVEAFGGLEAFTATTSGYYDNFYSDAEKQSAMYRDLEKSLSAMGLSVPKTKEEFRDLIEAQDLTTDSGRKNYASLMKLSSLFSEMIGITDELSQAENDRVSAARESFLSQLRLQLEFAENQKNIWQSLFDFLSKTLKDLYGTVESTAAMQVSEARNIIRNVQQTGVFPEQQVLEDAVGTITGSFSDRNYKSKVDAEKDRLRFAAQLEDLKSVAGDNLRSAKNTFDLLKLQLDSIEDGNILNRQQLQALFSIDGSIQDLGSIIQLFGTGGRPSGGSGGSSGYYGGGSVGTRMPGYTPSKGRVDYSSDEAISSREKFTNWYQGLKYNAQLNKDYEVPDWMKMLALSSEDELGTYLFFKNNPEIAADYERIMTGGLSQLSTDGSSLIRSDLNSMPSSVADYFRANPSDLASYESFGLDPVLARMLYESGPEQFGLDARNTNFTDWLRTHSYQDGRIVESDNPRNFAMQGWSNYSTARWNTTDGTIVDVDGTIYSIDGRVIGKATPELMYSVFGNNSANDVRSRYDVYISSGMSANDLVSRMISEGLSMQEIATAYGTTPDVVAENLRNGGATDIPAYAAGGTYSGGLALVGENGPELINFNRGGYVHTASQTRDIMSQDGVIQALTTLNSKVEMLEAAARSTAISNNKIAKLLDRVTPDGDSLQVKTVAGSVTTTV